MYECKNYMNIFVIGVNSSSTDWAQIYSFLSSLSLDVILSPISLCLSIIPWFISFKLKLNISQIAEFLESMWDDKKGPKGSPKS